MCGILGVATVRGRPLSVGPGELERMQGRLAHRGPDGAGTWRHENVVLAHRRLAVRDLSARGEQPMATPDGRFHLVYNGELYNDAELRHELLEAGAVSGGFRSRCDTETVLWAFAAWGTAAFSRLRGMFALAVYDSREHALVLARDPLGIKPLYFHVGDGELTFASEPPALLAHPRITQRPNLPMVSAYLTTVRTVLAGETLFEGLFALEPGETLRFDASSGDLSRSRFHRALPVEREGWDETRAADAVRATLEDAVTRHLEADVPVCSLLSGGLDSSILCRLAADRGEELRTWCAGGVDGPDEGEDFQHARDFARELGSEHHEVHVDRERFAEDWTRMVGAQGIPLSTPNEVAIHAVSRDLAAGGQVVALSGEGADELFAGYEPVMEGAASYEADVRRGADARSGGRYQLESAAWASPNLKGQLLAGDVWQSIEEDAFLFASYDELFESGAREAGPEADPLDAHLRFLRRANLTGLLQRLDTASMLASVEGRTPFADVAVAELADRMPMQRKYSDGRGKRVLRRAWETRLPASILRRPKASFPLPFESWIADRAGLLETSSFARELFAPALRREIARDPARYFHLAWPMVNLAIWGSALWD